MKRLVLVGISHKKSTSLELESYQTALSAEVLQEKLVGVKEWVLISTCNRWDLLAVLPANLDANSFRKSIKLNNPQQLYAYSADAALEQLIRITSSLDSLNPGEDQIMKQVKEAFAEAKSRNTVGKKLSFVFQTAFNVAKKIRREVELAPLNTSLFSLARPDIEKLATSPKLATVIGTGEMGSLAAKSLNSLRNIELIVVNRSLDKAQNLAKNLNCKAMSLAEYLDKPLKSDILVLATPVKGLIDDGILNQLDNLEIIVDLGIPKNLADNHNFTGLVLDIDSLKEAGQLRRQKLIKKLAQAEMILQEELIIALDNWAEKDLGPIISNLRSLYTETISDSLEPDEAQKLAHKFAHIPTKGLRAIAREYGLDAAKVFLSASGLLANEIN